MGSILLQSSSLSSYQSTQSRLSCYFSSNICHQLNQMLTKKTSLIPSKTNFTSIMDKDQTISSAKILFKASSATLLVFRPKQLQTFWLVSLIRVEILSITDLRRRQRLGSTRSLIYKSSLIACGCFQLYQWEYSQTGNEFLPKK